MPPLDRIESNPDVCGGEACIRGTRIMVWLLVHLHRRGKAESDLLAAYPGVTAADLDDAWDYYRQHPDEVEQAIWINTVAVNHPPGMPVPAWSLVYARLIGLREDQIRSAFEPAL